MATTLTLLNSTPCTATFKFESTDSTPAALKQSGASGNAEINVSSLSAGPLKAYLTKLTDWSPVTAGQATNTRIRWRFTFGGAGPNLIPVANSQAGSLVITTAGGPPQVVFAPGISAAQTCFIEMTYAHSLAR